MAMSDRRLARIAGRQPNPEWPCRDYDDVAPRPAAELPTLQTHQQDAVDRILDHFKTHSAFLLGHGMGLGKTITSLHVMFQRAQELKPRGRPFTALVLAPASLLDNWAKEVRGYCRAPVRITIYQGDGKWYRPPSGKRIHVIITNIESLAADTRGLWTHSTRVGFANRVTPWFLKSDTVDMLIVDEAHKFRHHNTSTFSILFTICWLASKTLLLSGSPLNTAVTDLASLMALMVTGDEEPTSLREKCQDYLSTLEVEEIRLQKRLGILELVEDDERAVELELDARPEPEDDLFMVPLEEEDDTFVDEPNERDGDWRDRIARVRRELDRTHGKAAGWFPDLKFATEHLLRQFCTVRDKMKDVSAKTIQQQIHDFKVLCTFRTNNSFRWRHAPASSVRRADRIPVLEEALRQLTDEICADGVPLDMHSLIAAVLLRSKKDKLMSLYAIADAKTAADAMLAERLRLRCWRAIVQSVHSMVVKHRVEDGVDVQFREFLNSWSVHLTLADIGGIPPMATQDVTIAISPFECDVYGLWLHSLLRAYDRLRAAAQVLQDIVQREDERYGKRVGNSVDEMLVELLHYWKGLPPLLTPATVSKLEATRDLRRAAADFLLQFAGARRCLSHTSLVFKTQQRRPDRDADDEDDDSDQERKTQADREAALEAEHASLARCLAPMQPAARVVESPDEPGQAQRRRVQPTQSWTASSKFKWIADQIARNELASMHRTAEFYNWCEKVLHQFLESGQPRELWLQVLAEELRGAHQSGVFRVVGAVTAPILRTRLGRYAMIPASPTACMDGYRRAFAELLLATHTCSTRIKMLVFSEWVAPLERLHEFLLQEFSGRQVHRYGSQLSLDERLRVMQEFENDNNNCVMLGTYGTMAHGLNVTCAEQVVLLEPCWNPQVELQAKHRVFRIGQTVPTTCFRLYSIIEQPPSEPIATIEGRVHEVQRRRLEMVEILLRGKIPTEELSQLLLEAVRVTDKLRDQLSHIRFLAFRQGAMATIPDVNSSFGWALATEDVTDLHTMHFSVAAIALRHAVHHGDVAFIGTVTGLLPRALHVQFAHGSFLHFAVQCANLATLESVLQAAENHAVMRPVFAAVNTSGQTILSLAKDGGLHEQVDVLSEYLDLIVPPVPVPTAAVSAAPVLAVLPTVPAPTVPAPTVPVSAAPVSAAPTPTSNAQPPPTVDEEEEEFESDF